MAKLKSIMGYDLENCIICGSPYVQIHHCIYGTSNRKQSDKYGLIVPLCREHHTGNSGVHHDKNLDIFVKQMAQTRFEEVYGSREEFIKIFGKSYL